MTQLRVDQPTDVGENARPNFPQALADEIARRDRITRCDGCGSEIRTAPGRGRPARFCTEACRSSFRRRSKRDQQEQDTSAATAVPGRPPLSGRDAGACGEPTPDVVRGVPGTDVSAGQEFPVADSPWYHAKFAAPAGQSADDGSRRRSRERLRQLLNQVSTVERCTQCGRGILGGAAVIKAAPDKGAFVSGVESCGRIWLCPVCAAKIRNRRGDEVAEGVGRWIGKGGDAHFFTATLPHDQGDALRASLGVLADSWRWMTSHKSYKTAAKRFGMVGYIKAVEVTHGRNGWHPHIHAVVLVDQEIPSLELFAWYGQLDALWARALVRHGWSAGKAPYRFRALPVQLGDSGRALAAYVTKVQDSGLGNELARADLKGGRKSSRTPLQILADFGSHGDQGDLDLWHEYEEATAGRSAIRWSRGLRDLVLPDVEQATDEEIAAEEQDGENIAVILPHTWYKICDIPGAPTAVKEAVEQDGWEGLIRTLLAYRIPADGVLRPEEWFPAEPAVSQNIPT